MSSSALPTSSSWLATRWRQHVGVDKNRKSAALTSALWPASLIIDQYSMDNSSHENHENNGLSWKVVVTAPSSPDSQHAPASVVNVVGVEDSSVTSYPLDSIFTSQDTLTPSSQTNLSNMPPSTFEELLASSQLPEPGPEHFLVRRQLWLTPRVQRERAPAPSTKPMTAQLQTLLEGPVENLYKEANWKGGVGKICERILVNKETLSQRLPLRHLVRSHAELS